MHARTRAHTQTHVALSTFPPPPSPHTHAATARNSVSNRRTLKGGALSSGAAMLAAFRSSLSSFTRTATGNAELRGAAAATDAAADA
eukprot:364948-Chlamydomonas_euryale.AAC.22